MTSEPSETIDPDADPQLKGGPSAGEPDASPSVDGVREASSVQDDPEDRDDPDADPDMLAQNT